MFEWLFVWRLVVSSPSWDFGSRSLPASYAPCPVCICMFLRVRIRFVKLYCLSRSCTFPVSQGALLFLVRR